MVQRNWSGTQTFDDFLKLVQEDQKLELIDGRIYMASPESVVHQRLTGWLYRLMSDYVEELNLGEVYFTKFAFRLSAQTAPEPDVAYVRAARLHLLEDTYFAGAPDVAIEIVSPDSIERDYEHKRLKYEEAGVEEYWILDPKEKQATFFVRSRDGSFKEAMPDGVIFRSRVIPGFDVDVGWFWQRRLPSRGSILAGMLASRTKKQR